MAAGPHVLIVEDQWLIAEDQASGLRSGGYRIAGPVPSVERAMRLLDSQQVDAALLDICVNDGDSYAVADRLAAASIPFAFLSGLPNHIIPVHLRNIEFLPKPVPNDTLLSTVRKLLTGR